MFQNWNDCVYKEIRDNYKANVPRPESWIHVVRAYRISLLIESLTSNRFFHGENVEWLLITIIASFSTLGISWKVTELTVLLKFKYSKPSEGQTFIIYLILWSLACWKSSSFIAFSSCSVNISKLTAQRVWTDSTRTHSIYVNLLIVNIN